MYIYTYIVEHHRVVFLHDSIVSIQKEEDTCHMRRRIHVIQPYTRTHATGNSIPACLIPACALIPASLVPACGYKARMRVTSRGYKAHATDACGYKAHATGNSIPHCNLVGNSASIVGLFCLHSRSLLPL